MRSKVSKVLFGFVLAGCFAPALAKDIIYGLDQTEVINGRGDVWFDALSEHDLRAHWSEDDGRSILDRIQGLQSFTTTAFVTVKLVGFQDAPFDDAERSLRRYFEGSRSATGKADAKVLHTKGNQSHELPITTKFIYRITMAPDSLRNTISEAIAQYAHEHAADHLVASSTHAEQPESVHVDPQVVEELLARDFGSSSAYTIYVLNPRVLKMPKTGPPIRYTYVEPKSLEEEALGGAFTASNPRPTCGATHWVGPSGRFAWIDLTAGPAAFGPETMGHGFVTHDSLPRVEQLSAKGPHWLTLNAKLHAFMATLAAGVHKTSLHLIRPPVHHMPVAFHSKVVISIVIVHDTDVGVDEKSRTKEIWETVAAQLQALTLSGQTIEVKIHQVTFEECDLCVAAYSHSLRSHTSNVLAEGLRTQVNQNLEGQTMARWLEYFERDFWGIKDHHAENHDGTTRVLSAYVYNLATEEPVLVDRLNQAKAFGDTVIAVQTKSPPLVVDMTCDGKSMQFDPQDSSRATLGALLQSGWGVAATEELWGARGRVEHSYLWSVGHTPFGYFSASRMLSFAQRDAGARNVLFSEVNHTVSLLGSFEARYRQLQVRVRQGLPGAVRLQILRRVNMLEHKLGKARDHLSLNNFNLSLSYLRSAQKDVTAMIELEIHTRDGFKMELQCGQDMLRQQASGISDKQSNAPLHTLLLILEVVVVLALLGLAAVACVRPDAPIVARMTRHFSKKKRF